MRFDVAEPDGSMSMLIPGPDPLRSRFCEARQAWRLVNWFLAVEPFAWAAIENRFGDQRPDHIFLVLGQTLANEFAITHQQYGSPGCEVSITTTVDLPAVADTTLFLGHGVQTVSPSRGIWEVFAQRSADTLPRSYSVFLQTCESMGPMKLVKPTRSSRISFIHKYNPFRYVFYLC